MSTATALPAEVQLAKEKPQGAFCLRTRYALSANSANSWPASSLVSLPLQTGTPGTFTDVKQGCINCTLQINNSNAYVDYLNFGPCGAIIFFEEMRVYSSGTPVEENLRYSETVDLLMEQGGWQDQPYHVYRRNKWRANNGCAKDRHVNFVKPAMVDSTGTPMHGRTPFMDKNSAVYHPASIAFGYATTADGTAAAAQTDLASKTLSISNINGTAVKFGQIFGTDCSGYFNDEALQPVTSATLVATAAYCNHADTAAAATSAASGLGRLVAGRNSHISYRTGDFIPSSSIGAWRNTQVAHYGNNAAALETTYPWLPCATYTPALWPDFQPSTLQGEVDDAEVDTFIGKTKLAEYFKYLANVRSLPIGLSGSLSGEASLVATQSYASPGTAALSASSGGTTNTGNNSYTEYRVSMPFVSGIYGILADKMFPDLLIGANNIRIEFKLASNQKALWLTMDPCRRVPGTVRDFAPFTGSSQGAVRQCKTIKTTPTTNTAGGGGLAQFDAADAALGCSFAGLCYFQAGDFTSYNNGAGGVSTGPIASFGAGGIVPYSNIYTTASAMGEDFGVQVSPSIAITNQAIAVGQISIPRADGVGAKTAATQAGFSTSHFSNLPKPQYIPVANPWLAKGFGTVRATYINERQSCYGTYLPASVPQSRRCQVSSRLGVVDNFSNAGVTVFSIRDLQYIGEQVQLDDISTSAIITHAATSEIVVWTRGYRSFEANCTTGKQQNIILPIQIGQATALYLVFRAAAQLTSQDYYANSFSNPFTGLSFSNTASQPVGGQNIIGKQGIAPDVGGTYQLKSSLDTSSMGQFSYQLFSGTKQYPLQPIQTVSEMLVEREKSTHSLHNWNWCGSEAMSLTRWANQQNLNNLTGLSFDPFLDMGFFTTFIPIAALDDQTITQNPYFAIAEVRDDGTTAAPDANYSACVRIRGIRQESYSGVTANNFIGVLNKFVPPIGTFFLGWDFESWTNHEDLMRTGKFLGQEQLSIRMTGTELMDTTNVLSPSNTVATATQITCTAIVPHVVKMSFVPGGHMLTYY